MCVYFLLAGTYRLPLPWETVPDLGLSSRTNVRDLRFLAVLEMIPRGKIPHFAHHNTVSEGRGNSCSMHRPRSEKFCPIRVNRSPFKEVEMAKIRSVVVEGNREHGYRTVQVLFGTNFFLEITESDGRVSFLLGAHHEAFKADASEAKGELEKYIKEIMEKHPESVFEEE